MGELSPNESIDTVESRVDPESQPQVEVGKPRRRIPTKRVVRISLFIGLIAGLIITGKVTGIADELSPEWVRDTVQEAGVWGYVIYVVAFVLAELAQVPGWMFIAAGTLAYGRLVGFVFAYIASVASVATGFALVRWVGGQPLAEIKQRHAKMLLSKLDERPIFVVFLIRLVFWVSPPLTYALALTKIRFRDYMIGSMAGLVLPVFGLSFLFEWVIGFLEKG